MLLPFFPGCYLQGSPERCGNCDLCDAEAERGAGADPAPTAVDAPAFATDSHVLHPLWGGGTVMTTEGDRVTVFFESEGYKVLDIPDVLEHDLLTPKPI